MIGTRVLTLALPEGEVDVEVSIEAPASNGTSWGCRYQIGWPDGVRTNAGHGVDAIQAIVLALQMVGVELYSSPYHARGQLRWQKPGDGYGFPVPKNVRDMLVGSDKTFDG